jgi:hypothetical protein
VVGLEYITFATQVINGHVQEAQVPFLFRGRQNFTPVHHLSDIIAIFLAMHDCENSIPGGSLEFAIVCELRHGGALHCFENGLLAPSFDQGNLDTAIYIQLARSIIWSWLTGRCQL